MGSALAALLILVGSPLTRLRGVALAWHILPALLLLAAALFLGLLLLVLAATLIQGSLFLAWLLASVLVRILVLLSSHSCLLFLHFAALCHGLKTMMWRSRSYLRFRRLRLPAASSGSSKARSLGWNEQCDGALRRQS
jgi:hypothetical protein